MAQGYKIFNCKNKSPFFIYRSLHKTRQVPIDTWLIAEKKRGRDGNGLYYETGFHVFPTLAALITAANGFRNLQNKVVVTVEFRGIFLKPTKSVAVLAKKLRLNSKAWKERRPLRKFKKVL